MKRFAFERRVPFSARQMFDLVADLASYPSFVPNCSHMRVIDAPDGEKFARMRVALGPISRAYTSRVRLDRQAGAIAASAHDGPFSRLDSLWSFTPEGQGCRVAFDISFEIANPLLAAVAEPAFARKQEEIVEAFLREAKRRYG
ncbi:MAG: type II toxin-antitoxin system RatA family toxin [Cucumibacter sp.]